MSSPLTGECWVTGSKVEFKRLLDSKAVWVSLFHWLYWSPMTSKAVRARKGSLAYKRALCVGMIGVSRITQVLQVTAEISKMMMKFLMPL